MSMDPTSVSVPAASPTKKAPDPTWMLEERRSGIDRRDVAGHKAAATGLERRRGPGRRRSDFVKSAEEGQMTGEQFLFVQAIDAYKRVNQTPYPTWTQVLEVMRKLGYRKTCPSTLQLTGAEDWREPADAPAFPPAQEQYTSSLPGSRSLQPDERD